MKKVKTAIFPVGGLGTRFLPATKSMPKEMLPVANKPIIQYAYEEAKKAGIEKFIFITGRNKNAISDHFDYSYELEAKLNIDNRQEDIDKASSWLPDPGNIIFIRQQKPLGLGHAVWCARKSIADDEPFAVILADELIMDNGSQENFLSKMIDLFYLKGSNSPILGVDRVNSDEINKYGIIQYDSSLRVANMVEKPAIGSINSNLAIIGRYILTPEIFNYLEDFKIGFNNEIQLTDAMNEMSQNTDYFFQEMIENRFDCGNVLGYIEANLAFSLNDGKISDQVRQILTKYIN